MSLKVLPISGRVGRALCLAAAGSRAQALRTFSTADTKESKPAKKRKLESDSKLKSHPARNLATIIQLDRSKKDKLANFGR